LPLTTLIPYTTLFRSQNFSRTIAGNDAMVCFCPKKGANWCFCKLCFIILSHVFYFILIEIQYNLRQNITPIPVKYTIANYLHALKQFIMNYYFPNDWLHVNI